MEPLLGIAMIRNPFEQTLRQGRDKMKEDKVEQVFFAADVPVHSGLVDLEALGDFFRGSAHETAISKYGIGLLRNLQAPPRNQVWVADRSRNFVHLEDYAQLVAHQSVGICVRIRCDRHGYVNTRTEIVGSK